MYTVHIRMQDYVYWYNMACDVRRTYAIQTLHVRYVQFSGKVGDGWSRQLSPVSHPPFSPMQRVQASHQFALCQAVCQSYRVGGWVGGAEVDSDAMLHRNA